ncbi:ATP-dependent Clp protease proteolytic subunit [Theileria orientalis strain Shintoku]|uniref:ATP-dependent Clp protease proteolytic subunit n=1 Tax=Theileria orientalis strain Shintoku TaxID=869250 RepID=J7M8K0_THEOR|nr:ATP-dependent Clp protease proteolytic subunit [Theileria orientalis strain Shintoku]PVC51762.1 ATP-dependent Clp protease proteolytic subunit [Theileria orientalis]BAM42363.1 ATP-dependent Clp protease proteolytic subunit [Theileria orientalis strain Shintoku]|eukprot:XP_009692664.1 ATP-dependent Clp protease proteolytic subunit [Theileria orientalis strain Shintoku]
MRVFYEWLTLTYLLIHTLGFRRVLSHTGRFLSHHSKPRYCFLNSFKTVNNHNNKGDHSNIGQINTNEFNYGPIIHNFSQLATDEDKSNYFERTVDEFFVKNRTIFLSGELNDKVSFRIISSILRINENDPNLPIKFYINSPGGSVTAAMLYDQPYSGLAIYDLLQSLKMPVETISLGQAASMGAFLLASGTKGKRFAMPNSRIMIHQPLGGAHGQASDIEIQANEILQVRHILNSHLSHFTGKSIETIEKDCTRDNYMRPSEAIEYGLIDAIIETKTSHILPELPEKV